MTRKNMLIVGSGSRVHATTLPVLKKLGDLFSIHKICSKDRIAIRFGNREYATEGLERLASDAFAGIDLIYVAVTKGSVPKVLSALVKHPVAEIDLLIETPVLLFKHLCYADLFRHFRNVWVAEDCVALPCFDVVKDLLNRAVIGELKRVVFDRSAYKYHGLATMKHLLGCSKVTSAFRKKISAGAICRSLRFANRTNGQVFEPRDYEKGRFILEGNRGSISDYPDDREGNRLLEPILSDGACSGFRIGGDASHLDREERELMGQVAPGTGVTSLMEGMKRVGFFRMMKRIHRGDGGYPLQEALDDMAVDYYLEKIGFYFANPLMSVKSRIGSRLLKTATRLLAR
jgi:hypothetical protein